MEFNLEVKPEPSDNDYSISVKEEYDECDYEDKITIGPTIVQGRPTFKGYTYTVVKEEYHESVNNSPTREFSDDENASKSTHIVHKDNVSTEQDLKCYLCHEKLPKAKFHSHMLKHSREKKLSCAKCKVKYLQQSKLNAHMLRRHTTEENLYCKICTQKFPKKEILIHHMTMHTCEIFSCDICMNTFEQKSKLTVHLRKHVGGKIYTCEQCNKEFESPSGLMCHQRTHSGERPFNCDTCGLNFARSSKLFRHMRQHNGANPHKCYFCEKTFVHLIDMQRHSKTH